MAATNNVVPNIESTSSTCTNTLQTGTIAAVIGRPEAHSTAESTEISEAPPHISSTIHSGRMLVSQFVEIARMGLPVLLHERVFRSADPPRAEKAQGGGEDDGRRGSQAI